MISSFHLGMSLSVLISMKCSFQQSTPHGEACNVMVTFVVSVHLSIECGATKIDCHAASIGTPEADKVGHTSNSQCVAEVDSNMVEGVGEELCSFMIFSIASSGITELVWVCCLNATLTPFDFQC